MRLLAGLLLLITNAIQTFGQTINSDNVGPQFSFTTSRVHDFGALILNAKKTYSFQFINSGSQPLLITNMRSRHKGVNSPPYKLLMSYTKSPIPPGATSIIEITAIAQADTGSIKAELLVTSNAANANYPLLRITGMVVPIATDTNHVVTDTLVPIEFRQQIIGKTRN